MWLKFAFVTDPSITSNLNKPVSENGNEMTVKMMVFAVFVRTMKLKPYTIPIPKSYPTENVFKQL